MRYDSTTDENGSIITMSQSKLQDDFHFHQCIEFNYIEEGKMTVRFFDHTEVFEKGEISFVSSFVPHSVITVDKAIVRNLIIPVAWCIPFYEHSNDFASAFSMKNKQANAEIFAVIDNILQLIDTPYTDLLKAYINVLLFTIKKNYPASTPLDKMNDVVLCMSITSYISQNFKQTLTVGMLAKHFGYNSSYFSHLFNKMFHCSFKSYLNRIRINFIEVSMLHSPKRNLLSLIYEAGFNESSTYYRAIKANPPPEKRTHLNEKFYAKSIARFLSVA